MDGVADLEHGYPGGRAGVGLYGGVDLGVADDRHAGQPWVRAIGLTETWGAGQPEGTVGMKFFPVILMG